MLGSGSWFFREASPENIPNLSKMNQNNIELCKTTGFWWVDRPYITSKESELPMIFRSHWGDLALQELWVQQHREYRVWRKKNKKTKKNRATKKNKLENQNQGRKQEKPKKNCGKCRFFCFFLFFFLIFVFFFVFFLFFLFLLVILPVDLFFWWFCFF